MEATSRPASSSSRGLVMLLVLGLLAGLPLAVWLDLRNLTETALWRQASDLNSVISSVRGYYASNVVEGMLDGSGKKIQIFSEHMTGLDFYLDPAW